jgi:pimeloyl-ACP methyl ester carboxylesterase
VRGRTEVTEAGGVRLGSYVVGKPQPADGVGQPRRGDVVIVPGLCVSSYLRPAADALADVGYRAHLVDPPGWPYSAPPARRPTTLADLAAPLVRWLEKRDLADVLLVGQSVGAQLAAHVAAAAGDRVRLLVLQGPTFDPRYATLPRAAFRLALDFPRERPSLLAAEVPEWLRVGLRQVWPVARLAVADRLEQSLPRVRAPVLVAVGEHETLASRPWTQSLVTSVRSTSADHVVMAGLPHSSPHADPEAFARLVVTFDRTLAGPAARRPDH